MACCKCLFINQSDFYDITPLPPTVDGSVIEKVIYSTQIKFIKKLLCHDLYDELCLQVDTNTISAINLELLCYIRDVHVRFAFADFLFLHPIKITKESVVRKASDESEFVDRAMITDQIKWWQMEATTFSDELRKFLKDNVSLNPLYDSCKCSCKYGEKTYTNNYIDFIT